MKIIRNIFLVVWTIFCFIGVVGNFSHYGLIDWFFIVPFVTIPYLIVLFVSYKLNKKRPKNGQSKETLSTNDISEEITKAKNVPEPPNVIEPQVTNIASKPSTNNQLSKQTATEQLQFTQEQLEYIETNQTVCRTDNKAISDDEIPQLIQAGYEKALQAEKQSSNPKFHRTRHEEELSLNFEMKYSHEINILIEEFETLYRDAYQSHDLDQKISLLNEATKAFEKAKKFCYSKGKGGTIYFQDMWEYLHNSNNQCFSYLDNIQNALEEAEYLKNEVIPEIVNTIMKNDGILQKDIYKLLPSIDRSIIQSTIKHLESDKTILRIKSKNSYELHILT